MYPDSRAAITETWSYYDCHNYAHRIRCPIIVNTGLQDNVCPGEAGYAVYDQIASTEKRLYAYDGHAHDANGYGHEAIINTFFWEKLQP